jgi:organic hydroperoxide reductase OsmC/OhrA
MATMTIEYRSIPDTGAAVGRAGIHTVIADRPEGKAGGTGLGFNGGELLALALGGCFCNDVHYVAAEMGLRVADLKVSVSVGFGGEPLVATEAIMTIACELFEGADAAELLNRAKARCTIANTLNAGVPVTMEFQ